MVHFQHLGFGRPRAFYVGMRGWIIVFTLLTFGFLMPFPSVASQTQWVGGNLCGIAVFGTLTALCGATLIGRAKA